MRGRPALTGRGKVGDVAVLVQPAGDAEGACAPPVARRRSPAACAAGCEPVTTGCVADLATPPERLAATRRAIAADPEPLVTLTHLLHLCRDEHAVLRAGLADPAAAARVTAVVAELSGLLPSEGAADLISPTVAAALAGALEPVDGTPPVVVARALAELVDGRYGHTFAASFARRSPYQPGVGDPVPLDGPDLRQVTELPPTSPPWRLANRLDQTRRVRLAGEWAAEFRVIFDYSLFDLLTGLVSADTVVATVHPNSSLEEFELPQDRRERSFPVRPRDVDGQRRRIDAVISAAVARGASIIVLPELSVTETLAHDLQGWVRRGDGPRLLVAGSYHHEEGPAEDGGGEEAEAPRPRRNTALAWVRGAAAPLVHDKHSAADRPVVEDITPDGWPELRVHVTADGWHVVIAICRDLLNPRAVQALTEAGANLVLVPAMSETLVPFGSPVAHLVGDDQALVVVANNPAEWSRPGQAFAPRPARALVGHPGFGQLTRWVPPAEAGPGFALLHVRSGELKWVPVTAPGVQTDDLPAAVPDRRPVAPPWARQLSPYTRQAPLAGYGRTTVELRAAAVLVLVVDRPDGPRVVLTRRSRDLADYPGELVFPGGATDDGDDGPVGTALREAHEEIGLDAASVEVIGALPSFALLESRFHVTPVLAWTVEPAFSDTTNLAEVDIVLEVPLYSPGGAELTALPDGNRYGRMTSAVLQMLAGILSQETMRPMAPSDRPRAADLRARGAVPSR